MKIKEVKLLTNDIEATVDFYSKILGIPIVSHKIDSVTFQIGVSRLSFTKTETTIDPYYHFAINITQNKVQQAINWLQDKGVLINKVNNDEVVHFQSWNSDSVYFYDSIGNIVEFIARHNLTIVDDKSDNFNYYDLLNISEIGLPTIEVITLTKVIQEQYNEQIYISSDSLFSPIGDEEGLFILSSIERKWLGSDKKVEIFPLEVVIVTGRNERMELLDYPYTIKSEEGYPNISNTLLERKLQMPFDIDSKFVIAVASSALFDLNESDRVFKDNGEEVYRNYQRKNENEVLGTGVAFPLIKRLLSINTSQDQIVEVVLLSRNDPDTGLRVFKSIEHYGLTISRAAFVTGNNPFKYMDTFNACLFLSGNPDDVKEAVEHGYPAGCIYPSDYIDDEDDNEIRLAFDFDGVIADDSAESIFQGGTLDSFHSHEKELASQPLPPGPLHNFFKEISKLQQRESQKNENDPEYKSRIRLAIATARNAPAHERVITTLRKLDIRVDEAFFLGGIEKIRVLNVFKPHIFFDDQVGHIEGVATNFPSVHVPFGVVNKSKN